MGGFIFAASLRRLQRELCEIELTSVLGPLGALGLGQHPFQVHLGLETGKKFGTSCGGCGLALGVKG